MSQPIRGSIPAAVAGRALPRLAAAALLAIVGVASSACSDDKPAPPVVAPTAAAAPAAPTVAPTVAPPPPTAAPEPTAETVSGAEAKELVSPVALYPDPVLILVLQASTMPLQVVEAQRFLERYEKDTSLQPDADWDSSIMGLLNYPSVIVMMGDSLDWTQALGDVVLDDLGAVQTGVQDLRWSAYNLGALRSNEYQQVVVSGREVRILPATADSIALPQYDAGAMLAAAESAPAAAAPAAAPAAAAPAAPAAAPVEAAAVAPAAVAPVAVPAVAYSEPQSSFWSNAAIFAGGAAVGGLLGYAIFGEDDDDDYHGGGYQQPSWSRDINIEDSTIVVGDRYNRDRVEKQLRDRADRPANRPATRPNRPVPVSDVNRPATRPMPAGARPGGVAKPAKPVELPRPVKPVAAPRPANPVARPAAAAPVAQAAKRPGDARPAPKGGLGDVRPAPQVKKESQRGQTSRAVQNKVAAKPAAPARQPAPKVAKPAAPQRGGGMSPRGGGQVKKDANRGKQSRGGGGGGGGGGKQGRGKR